MNRVRVAAVQYFIRPIASFEDFRAQVEGLVETARGYHCRLLVFPEYFTVQLLTLDDISRPLPLQIRKLAGQVDRFTEMMCELARRGDMYIVAGTIPVIDEGADAVYNESRIFAPSGEFGIQGKLHMTRFEREDWDVSPRSRLRVFETDFGRLSIMICYDVEFPELARVAARNEAYLLVVPSWTDNREGFLRVRYCAHARTIENQLYVVHAPTVGSLPMVPAISLNYGQAALLTPSDYPFARDGILKEGIVNQEMMVIGDLNLDVIAESRERGAVLPLRDSERSAEVAAKLDVVAL
jgi:predicted amidohydrolase